MVYQLDNKEVLAFIVKAETKLKHSKALFEIEGYADSVSLSYYSMFLMAKALLNKKGFTAKTHEGTLNLFNLKYVHEDTFNKDIYVNFAAAQSKREDADYNAIDYITKEIAEELISQAEEFLNEAEKFL